MKKTLLILTALLFYFSNSIVAQDESNSTTNNDTDNIYHNWYNKSPLDDKIYGAEVDKAYDNLLKDKESTTVIVAVIDGGIDITHEDLKDNIWYNKDEIPENGIDDDKNGYIDDIHGWNFLGNSKGENITNENLEITRIYREYKDRFENIDPKTLSEEDKELYDIFYQAELIYFTNLNEALDYKERITSFEKRFNNSYDTILVFTNKDTISINELDSINTDDTEILNHVNYLKRLFYNGFTPNVLEKMSEYSKEEVEYHLNLDFSPREIIGDDQNDLRIPYGNNNVYAPEAFHGTFVAGIIGAKRNNGIGINGIANDVQIMALKVVPNGDERDKDVAKAIRYAVDNGARIINMSFGKELSPQKQLVDEAILYAEEKGVLMVHAAGNDGLNIDKVKQYPTKNINDDKSVSNWITVGASSMNNDLDFAANFSNYGKNMVDIFAPGVDIESLAPESKYEIADGTSFSAPVVSGVAALLLSYYPELTYSDIKNIILNSALDFSNTKVYVPSEYSIKRKTTKFKKLSSTGGIISAYKAVKLAETYQK